MGLFGLGKSAEDKIEDARLKMRLKEAQQDAKINDRILKAESCELKNIERDLTEIINSAQDQAVLIKKLLDITRRLQTIREQSQIRKYRDTLQRMQASVVASLNKASQSFEKLESAKRQLDALRKEESAYKKRISANIRVGVAAVAGRPAIPEGAIRAKLRASVGAAAGTPEALSPTEQTALRQKLDRVEAMSVELTSLGIERDTIIKRIEGTIKPKLQPVRIAQLVDEAINNIYNNNFPRAISILSDLLNERRLETTIDAEAIALCDKINGTGAGAPGIIDRQRTLLAQISADLIA